MEFMASRMPSTSKRTLFWVSECAPGIPASDWSSPLRSAPRSGTALFTLLAALGEHNRDRLLAVANLGPALGAAMEAAMLELMHHFVGRNHGSSLEDAVDGCLIPVFAGLADQG